MFDDCKEGQYESPPCPECGGETVFDGLEDKWYCCICGWAADNKGIGI